MALANTAKTLSDLFLGTCLPSLMHNASRFKVQYMYFDEALKMYFRKSFVITAFDPQKISKTGDIALIKELQEKKRGIHHEVLEIVYPCGDVTDPVTGQKVVATLSREEIEEENKLYGTLESSFKYKAAPRRGWQENIRDYSHRDSYIKYHEFGEGDANKDQPFSIQH